MLGIRIVIVHDYLNQRGGAERVVLEMSKIWPQAPIYTSLYRPNSTFPEFQTREIVTSPLDRLPVDSGFRNLFPLYPSAFRSFGTLDADLVVSSSSGWAHRVQTSPDARHVVYCHTPARWLYGLEYANGALSHQGVKAFGPLLRQGDRRAARRPDLYIANSNLIQQRIKSTYDRNAPVVYPPVDVDRFTPSPRGERLLVVSRLLAYKRVDAIVGAATQAGIGLDIVGDGPAADQLRRMAGPMVEFHGRVEDDAVTDMMQCARAVCIAGHEDFGIVPVEAQAAGKPVIAFGSGGVIETVHDGLTGVLFTDYTPEAIVEAIRRCDQLDTSPSQIADHAQRFSVDAFRSNLVDAVWKSEVRP